MITDPHTTGYAVDSRTACVYLIIGTTGQEGAWREGGESYH